MASLRLVSHVFCSFRCFWCLIYIARVLAKLYTPNTSRQHCWLVSKGRTAMKHRFGIVLVVSLSATLLRPATAQLVALDRNQWNSRTTSILPITARQCSSISAVSNSCNYLSFGKSATVNRIGSNQVSWGRNSELTSGGNVATFNGNVPTKMFWSLTESVTAFGFEVMSNDLHEAQDFTVSYYNGTTLLGTLQQTSNNAAFWNSYDYFAGDVRLFAAEDMRGITGVDITFTSNSFSAAAFRVTSCSPTAVPEPSSVAGVLITVAGLTGCIIRRRYHVTSR